MPRRWIPWPLLAMILLVACAGGAPGQDGAATGDRVVTAFTGDLSASASAGGKVLPQRSAALAPTTSGRVASVPVETGDRVQAGDVLLRLETADLEAAVESARQDLALQQANLDGLLAEPLPEEIAAAEAAVAAAEARLQEVRRGPRPQEVAAAEADVAAAQAGVWAAAEQLDQAETGATEAEIARARADLAAAQLQLLNAERANEENPVAETHEAMLEAQEAVDIAQARVDALLAGPGADSVGAAQAEVSAAVARRDAGEANLNLLLAAPAESQVAAAEATLAQAEASLAALRDGPSEEEVRAAEAQVERAQVALEDARAALEDATLRAPFAGVVTAVHVAEGEIAGGVAVELLDADSLQVVLTVDEADVGSLQVGQPATITLEPWPEEEWQSEIVKIAPAAGAGGGDSALVSYEVYLRLGRVERPLRAGMTANASLLTAQREDVLLLPNRAIIADREAGRYYVDLVVSDEEAAGEGEEGVQVERVEVAIGLRDEENTQIVSGLQGGDRVRVRLAVPDGLSEPGSGGPFGE